MAKQKTKNPGRAALLAERKARRGTAEPAPLAAAKPRSKHKARLRSASGDPVGKTEPQKRVGKGKKAPRKGAAPKAKAIPQAEALAKDVSDQRPKRHKIARGAARIGVLERLELAVEEVRLGGRVSPRTRKLQMSGIPKMAQKVIEEAGEVAIEATLGNRIALINEAADLFYNVTVLLAAAGVSIDTVWSEMDRRTAVLGMAEKLPKAADPES